MNVELEPGPDGTGFVALVKDVATRFHSAMTVLTPRFLLGPDVSVVEVSACVQAAMVQQPSEELDFGR